MMKTAKMKTYKRITKAQARKLFNEGKPLTLCPCKVLPGGEWPQQSNISEKGIAELKEKAAWYSPDGISPSTILWKGDINKTAWDLMYNEWAFYNTNSEQGQYAHYYIIK
jgi:hypothetical protein